MLWANYVCSETRINFFQQGHQSVGDMLSCSVSGCCTICRPVVQGRKENISHYLKVWFKVLRGKGWSLSQKSKVTASALLTWDILGHSVKYSMKTTIYQWPDHVTIRGPNTLTAKRWKVELAIAAHFGLRVFRVVQLTQTYPIFEIFIHSFPIKPVLEFLISFVQTKMAACQILSIDKDFMAVGALIGGDDLYDCVYRLCPSSIQIKFI